MRWFLVFVVSALLTLLSASPAIAAEKNYTGSAQLTVRVSDATGYNSATQSYRTAVQGTVGPSLGSETNEFSLYVQSSSSVPDPGNWGIVSTLPVDGVTLQYWKYELTGDRLSGQMTDTHLAEAVAPNRIIIPDDFGAGLVMPKTFPMAAGTTIVGTLTDDRLVFRVAGNTEDRAHPFVIDGELRRSS